jgi:hypothetical protein
MGNDSRHPIEIIEQDIVAMEELGVTAMQVAERMTELTELAKPRLGNWIDYAYGKLRVKKRRL